MNILKRLIGQKQRESGSRHVTVNDPLVIQSPKIGFLNLLGQTGQEMLEIDRAAVAPMFRGCLESDSEPPVCDLLFAYLRILPDGRIDGTSHELRDIIGESRASIVVIASENDGASYVAAGKRKGQTIARANLVMTMGRKAMIFPTFIRALFEKMFNGKTMPLAWVELAPQIPGMEQRNVPDTIFAAEISHILFKG